MDCDQGRSSVRMSTRVGRPRRVSDLQRLTRVAPGKRPVAGIDRFCPRVPAELHRGRCKSTCPPPTWPAPTPGINRRRSQVTKDLDPLLLTRRLRLLGHERFEPPRWRPPADVYRSPRGWMVKLDVAGVSETDVEVRTGGTRLVIRGRRGDPGPGPGYARECLEIRYSEFERVIELAGDLEDLERARVEIRQDRGMLLVSIDIHPEDES